jgi:hypothetical protein
MLKTLSIIVLSSFMLAGVVVRAQAAVSVENDLYAVCVASAEGTFAVRSKATGKTFLAGGKLTSTGGTAKVVEEADKTFGNGKAIEIAYANGNRETVALYPGVPFVLFRSTFHNGGSEPVVLNHVSAVSAAVDLGKPLADLRTLGTGGLLEPAKNPGSYAFLAVVDPTARNGVVAGWLTHDRGSGVVFSPVQDEAVRIQSRLDYGRLRIKPGQDAAAETFAIGYFDDARLGLEAYADAIAKVYAIELPPHHPGYCTWYMEKHGGACNEKHLIELSEYAAKNLKPFGFDFIQIDDGWQAGTGGNGPKKDFTAHAPNGPYPNGMKATADAIRKLGLSPGIWFMPFAGNYKDPYFLEHQDWFAKGPDGKPFETAWGGTCLDLTHPAARENLRTIVQRIAHDWGYAVFKMDGFWTGSATRQIYVNDGVKEDGIGETEFSNPDKTNVEVLRDGARLVREAAGPKVFLLGCCVSQNMRSFGGSFGLLDAMRVGPDTGAGHIGAPHASRLWFLNGRVWWNDPDCVSVRAATLLEQARLNASFTTIAGDLFYNSDWMPDFPPERLDILRRCMPAHNLASRPVDVFEHEPARIWHLADTRETPRRDVVALYNWDKNPATVSCPAGRIGLPPAREYVGFDFWANKFLPPFKETVQAELPAGGSCRIFAIRPVADHPQLLSTSRHVTQGMIDVTGEKWDATQATLSAISKVVANDPYELRIVVPVGEKSWRATTVNVTGEGGAAGAEVEVTQDGPRLRVTIATDASRELKWRVQFAPGRVEAGKPKPVANLKASVAYRQIALTWDDNGAESYRVTRSDGTAVVRPSASFVDTNFRREKPYTYTVEAIGWDGTASPRTSLEVTPMAELKAPPKPPLPTVYLDDLKPQFRQNGWGKPGVNKSVEGKTLTVEGQRYEKGLGVHARSLIVCPIPAGSTRFVAVVGLDDEIRRDERASVTFEVYGDVKELGEQPVLLGQSPVLSSNTIRGWSFNLVLNTRHKELRLVVTDADDGIAADHADWVNAGFVAGSAAKQQR